MLRTERARAAAAPAGEENEQLGGRWPGKRTQLDVVVQRAASGSYDPGRRTRVLDELVSRRSGGQALPGGLRAPLERSLGADLGAVRLHTGGSLRYGATDDRVRLGRWPERE